MIRHRVRATSRRWRVVAIVSSRQCKRKRPRRSTGRIDFAVRSEVASAEIGFRPIASGSGSPDSASRSDARTVCSVPGNVLNLLFGRAFSSTCCARNRGFFLVGMAGNSLVSGVMVTAGVGIPLRCYLLSAVGFDYQRLGEKFQQMFPFILGLDQLWAVAPFLLMQKIGLGAAFAASAALLYVPFSERTLIRMAYQSGTKYEST